MFDQMLKLTKRTCKAAGRFGLSMSQFVDEQQVNNAK